MSPGQYVTFTVSDTGEGMTTSVVERVFEPYFTTKSARRGTGGGLAVVHGIVKAHKGGIFVDSEPGKGTTFKVYLPRCETVVDKERPKTVEPLTRARVLFVDDDDLVAGIGERTLSSVGHKVTVMTSSDDALMTFRSNPDQFDIVITDLHMPGMSGLDLAKEIMIVRPDVPVILCGGSTDAPSDDVRKETGIRRFLAKPVVPHDLEKAVAEVLA
jgi:CheY-like chemotaxis protein